MLFSNETVGYALTYRHLSENLCRTWFLLHHFVCNSWRLSGLYLHLSDRWCHIDPGHLTCNQRYLWTLDNGLHAFVPVHTWNAKTWGCWNLSIAEILIASRWSSHSCAHDFRKFSLRALVFLLSNWFLNTNYMVLMYKTPCRDNRFQSLFFQRIVFQCSMMS